MLITTHPSIDLLAERLTAQGFSVEKFELNSTSCAVVTAPNGNVWLTRCGHIQYPFINAGAAGLSKYKNEAYALATRSGVTIPQTWYIEAGTPSAADAADMLANGPLIVKPNKASLARGLSRNVRTVVELQRAVKKAQTMFSAVLVQKQVSGEEVRFAVCDGVVRAAILRESPQVIGDGKSTTQQLINQENVARKQLKLPYITYPQLTPSLIHVTDKRLQAVPQKGEVVSLGRGTMIRDGASMHNITESIHQSYIATATKLARQLGKGFVVVDMLIDDYRMPQTATNYAFLEFNMSPVLKLFYSCRDGNQYDVLSDLVPMVEQAITGVN